MSNWYFITRPSVFVVTLNVFPIKLSYILRSELIREVAALHLGTTVIDLFLRTFPRQPI